MQNDGTLHWAYSLCGVYEPIMYPKALTKNCLTGINGQCQNGNSLNMHPVNL